MNQNNLLHLAYMARKLGITKQMYDLWAMVYPYTRMRRKIDAALRKLFDGFVAPGDLVFDIGANHGQYTKLFLDMGAREVVAIEPIQRLARQLMRSRIQVLNMAVGEYNHCRDFYQADIDRGSSLSPEFMRLKKWTGIQWYIPTKIHVITLDTLVNIYREPSFIKIDAEGYECEIFRGMHFAPKAISFEFMPETLDKAEYCMKILDSLDSYECNYTGELNHEIRFEMEWNTAIKVIQRIKHKVKHPNFGDVWARRKE